MVSLKIAGILLVIDPGGAQSFDLPKSLFSRAIEWAILAILLVALLQHGRGIVPRTPLHLLVGAFMFANVLSAITGPERYTAVFGDQDRYLGLTFLVDMAVLYVAVAVAFRTASDWLALGAALLLATLAVFGYAVAQKLGLDPLPWARDPGTRPFSTLGHEDYLGHFQSVVAGAATGLLVFANGRWALPARLVALVMLAAAAGLTAVVVTRGTLVGIAAMLLALPFVYLRLSGGGRGRLARIGAGTAIAATAVFALLVATPVGERLQHSADDAGSGRLAIYQSAFLMFRERPLFGFGPDSFSVGYLHFRQGHVDENGAGDPQSSAHDWVLQTAATTGTVGLAAQIALLGGFVLLAWRVARRSPALIGIVLLGGAAYWGNALVSVGTIGVDWAPWVAMGAVAGLGEREAAPRRRALHPALFALLLAAGLAGAASGASALSADRAAAAARAAWSARQADAAVAAARAAVDADPGRADHWNWLGLAQEIRQDPAAAAEAYAAAALRAPFRSRYWVNLALARSRQATQTGDTAAAGQAVAAAKRAVDVDPCGRPANSALFDVATAFAQYELALRSAVAGVQECTADPFFETFVRDAARAEPDRALARQLVDVALRSKDSVRLNLIAAELAGAAGDPAAARAYAERTLELEPGNADALRMLADLRR
ncbi:MAG: O-antigen ligase family protein [Candidatus Limnocylindria bacterium]